VTVTAERNQTSGHHRGVVWHGEEFEIVGVG
jgi:hypothetical protein